MLVSLNFFLEVIGVDVHSNVHSNIVGVHSNGIITMVKLF